MRTCAMATPGSQASSPTETKAQKHQPHKILEKDVQKACCTPRPEHYKKMCATMSHVPAGKKHLCAIFELVSNKLLGHLNEKKVHHFCLAFYLNGVGNTSNTILKQDARFFCEASSCQFNGF